MCTVVLCGTLATVQDWWLCGVSIWTLVVSMLKPVHVPAAGPGPDGLEDPAGTGKGAAVEVSNLP